MRYSGPAYRIGGVPTYLWAVPLPSLVILFHDLRRTNLTNGPFLLGCASIIRVPELLRGKAIAKPMISFGYLVLQGDVGLIAGCCVYIERNEMPLAMLGHETFNHWLQFFRGYRLLIEQNFI